MTNLLDLFGEVLLYIYIIILKKVLLNIPFCVIIK